MRVKSKITLGLVFLFSVIVILGIISIHYLNLLTQQNQYLLKENFKSLQYSHQLTNSLSEIRNSFEPDPESKVSLNKIDYKLNAAIHSFEENLEKQKIISELSGEYTVVQEIEEEFELLKEYISVTRTKDYYFEKLLPLLQGLNLKINQIYLLNEQTISHRTEMAEATADRVIYTVAGIIVFCIVIAFSFMVRFPSYIAEPVDKLTNAIDQITDGDYRARVKINTRDEFGKLGDAFNSMAARMDEYEQMNLSKLLTEQKRMDTMVQKISEGILGLDSDFNVLFINPFAKKILGVEHGRVKGKSAKDLSVKNPIFQNIIQDIIEAGASGGKRYTRNKLIKGHLDGKMAYFIRKVIVTYADTEEGSSPDVNGYILMLKNITEFKELDQARTNFIATVSHELKTPISAIKMSLKLLRDERLSKLTEEQDEFVESIEWEVSRLLNITQELLNANELETGDLKLNPQNTDPYEIIEEAIDSVITLAEDRNIEINEVIQPDLPKIYVDMGKLTWVMVNFLTNAIKYSPVGSFIEVFVKSEADYIEFSVKDQGKGIPEEHRHKIFDRYYRMPGSEGKGTGLGLFISREIIRQMEGKIGVISDEEQGAHFYVRLFGVTAVSDEKEPLSKTASKA